MRMKYTEYTHQEKEMFMQKSKMIPYKEYDFNNIPIDILKIN